jgi:hypothetical protein
MNANKQQLAKLNRKIGYLRVVKNNARKLAKKAHGDYVIAKNN